MKTILLTTWGSYGDLFPYLGLARRLKTLGARPIVATCPIHAEVVTQSGIEFRPLHPDADPARTDLIARIMDLEKGSEVVVRELIVPAIREQFRDVTAAAVDVDAIVSHPVTFATPLVAEKARLPWLSVALAPISFFSVHDFPALPPFPRTVALHRVGGSVTAGLIKRLARTMTRSWTAPVRALRAEIGLPPGPDPLYEGQFSPFGTMALYSRALGTPQADWPPNSTQPGFVFDSGPQQEITAGLRDFLDAGEAPIVFTLGSSAVGAAGRFYETSAAAAEKIGRRAVLLIGRGGANRPVRALPPSIAVAEYAPHSELFARASVTVHHGGVGTTGQALRAGHPMLIVPFAHDQPDNAYRMSRLGVARVCYPKRYSVDRVARHLERLIDDASYARRAEEATRIVRAERGVETACERILSL